MILVRFMQIGRARESLQIYHKLYLVHKNYFITANEKFF